MTAPSPPPRAPPLHDGKWWWIGTFGVILLTLVFVIGLSLGGVWHASGPSTRGLRNDRYTHMVQSGQAQKMLERHQAMLEQMRVDASPPMLTLMNADPMWKLMRNGEYTKMLEDQQRQIDRMLGKGAP